MVFSGQGLSYAELNSMDLAKYTEAIAAQNLWNKEWKPKPPPMPKPPKPRVRR